MVELQGWGWNVLTLSFIATIVFTIWGALGLCDQIGKIWKNKSGESVSSCWFISGIFFFTACIIYGFAIHSLAMIISGLVRVPLSVPVLVGLKKFKGFKGWENWLFVFLAVYTVVMAFSPRKDLFYLVIALGGSIPAATQPFEIWRKRSSGVLSGNFLLVCLMSTAFWVIYGWAIGSMIVFALSLISLAIFIATGILWIKFRKVDS